MRCEVYLTVSGTQAINRNAIDILYDRQRYRMRQLLDFASYQVRTGLQVYRLFAIAAAPAECKLWRSYEAIPDK